METCQDPVTICLCRQLCLCILGDKQPLSPYTSLSAQGSATLRVNQLRPGRSPPWYPGAVGQRSRPSRPRRPPHTESAFVPASQPASLPLRADRPGFGSAALLPPPPACSLARPPWPQPFWNGADKGRAPLSRRRRREPPGASPRLARPTGRAIPTGAGRSPTDTQALARSRPLALAAIGRVF